MQVKGNTSKVEILAAIFPLRIIINIQRGTGIYMKHDRNYHLINQNSMYIYLHVFNSYKIEIFGRQITHKSKFSSLFISDNYLAKIEGFSYSQ